MWGRNAKILVATEPFWSIPVSWVFFYRVIFLSESLGLSGVQIGLLSTVLTFSSIVYPLAGGYLGDRFGRKRILLLFDSVGWLGSMAVWIVSKNIWFALCAYILEGLASIIVSVWECLLVEDTEPQHRASIYGYISVATSLGALSTPVAGYIIGSYGVDPGCRTLFALSFVSMIPLFTVQYIYLRETETGYRIMKEKSFAGVKGYLGSISMIRRNRIIATLLLTSIIGNSYYSVATYLPLYLIEKRGLGLKEEIASLVPAASSMSALIVASLIVPRLTSRRDYLRALSSGYCFGCLAILLLAFSPQGNLPLALVSGAILGVYTGTAFSVSRTFLTNEIEAVDSRARAKILSITLTLASLLNLPTPTLAGYLFSLNPKLPFIAESCALVVSLTTLILATRKRGSAEST